MDHSNRTHEYKFRVDNKNFSSEQPRLTGAIIKAMAGVEPSYGLFLEGHGKDPDRQISDTDIVDLSEPGREEFHSVPPATYGGVTCPQ
jgi:Multiubiquitin